MTEWIIIRNWDRYQSRKDERDWVWIKNHVRLLSDDDYMSLPEKTALMFHRLLLAYASTRGRLPVNTLFLGRLLGQYVTRRQLNLLVSCGFIEFSAAKPQRLGSETAARARVEQSREEQRVTSSRQRLPKDQELPAAAFETSALEQQLGACGWNGKQRARARAEPERATACLAKAQLEATDNVGAFAWTIFNAGDWPDNDEQPRVHPPMTNEQRARTWLANVGIHIPPLDRASYFARDKGIDETLAAELLDQVGPT